MGLTKLMNAWFFFFFFGIFNDKTRLHFWCVQNYWKKKCDPSFLGGLLLFSKYLLLIVIMGNYTIMTELIIEFPLCFLSIQLRTCLKLLFYCFCLCFWYRKLLKPEAPTYGHHAESLGLKELHGSSYIFFHQLWYLLFCAIIWPLIPSLLICSTFNALTLHYTHIKSEYIY